MDGLGTTHLSSLLADGHYINLESRSRISVIHSTPINGMIPVALMYSRNQCATTYHRLYWNVMSQRPDASSSNLDFRKLW